MASRNKPGEGYSIRTLSFVGLFLLTAFPFVTSPVALVAGFLFSLAFGNPRPTLTSRASKLLLKFSVIGLGFGVNFGEVIEVGKSSLVLTLISITVTIALGEVIGQIMKIPRNTRALICFGTAICGGSAIAAMAPVIKAEDEEIAVSLATIFLLNAVALVIFPPIGHLFELNQYQFGVWAALAIHDTSSVVGASAAFGAMALTVGTTTKLVRALWIAPYTMVAGFFWKTKEKASIPLFIIGFIAAAFINTWLPALDHVWEVLFGICRQSLVMTLFLIGAGLTRQVLKQVGIRPMLLGISLWFIVGSITLWLILEGYIG